jgi:hypothetical protein
MSVGGTIGGKRGGEARKKQMAEEHGGEALLMLSCSINTALVHCAL